nr:RNA-directed DNA polymerase, eukaryota [Tanacetum cinerariifolium]
MIDNINQDIEITLVDETQGRMNEENMFEVDDLDGDEVIMDATASEEVEKSTKVAEKEVSITDPVTTTEGVEVTTAATTPQISKDEITLAQTLIEIKVAKPKAITTVTTTTTAVTRPKARGVIKPKNLKRKSFDEIQKLVDSAMKRVNKFVDMNTEIVEERSKKTQAEVTKGSSKRAEDELGHENAKRRRLKEENESTELKRCLEIVLGDDDVTIEATPLSFKSPIIVDYKIYKERKTSYFKSSRNVETIGSKEMIGDGNGKQDTNVINASSPINKSYCAKEALEASTSKPTSSFRDYVFGERANEDEVYELDDVSTSYIFSYVDDAMFIGEWSDENLKVILNTLKCFFLASGVTVGDRMTRIKVWENIIVKLRSRLSKWKVKTLSVGGRLILLKSVLGASPIYSMSIFKVHRGMLKTMEAIRVGFLMVYVERMLKLLGSLGTRLTNVISDMVSDTQSTFVSGRQILDGPFILGELLQWCKRKNKQSMFFKVDFAKAYDSIRWYYLLNVLEAFGFGPVWCKWIRRSLNSAKTSILINGSHSNEFSLHCGLKQEDPLALYLFILIMESLHLSIYCLVDNGLFKGIQLPGSVIISHLFYADDAMFIGEWSDENLKVILNTLKCFFLASDHRILIGVGERTPSNVNHISKTCKVEPRMVKSERSWPEVKFHFPEKNGPMVRDMPIKT